MRSVCHWAHAGHFFDAVLVGIEDEKSIDTPVFDLFIEHTYR